MLPSLDRRSGSTPHALGGKAEQSGSAAAAHPAARTEMDDTGNKKVMGATCVVWTACMVKRGVI